MTLGHRAVEYVDTLGFRFCDSQIDGEDEWGDYESISEEVRLTTCNGVVTGIACDREFVFEGKNLIGLSEEQARQVLGSRTGTTSDAGLGHFVDFEDIGIELLIQDGLVTIVSMLVDPDLVLEEPAPR